MSVVRLLAYVERLQHSHRFSIGKTDEKEKALFHIAPTSLRHNISQPKSDFLPHVRPVGDLIPRPLIVSGPLISPFVTTVTFATVVIRVAELDGEKNIALNARSR